MRSTSIPNITVSQLISKIPGYRAHSVDDCHAEQCSPVLRGRNTATCAIPPALTFRPKWRKFGGSNVRPPAKIVRTVQGSPRSCCPWIRYLDLSRQTVLLLARSPLRRASVGQAMCDCVAESVTAGLHHHAHLCDGKLVNDLTSGLIAEARRSDRVKSQDVFGIC
jgi:hypothetical protein